MTSLSTNQLGLPHGYRQQPVNLTLDANRQGEAYWASWRIEASARYQRHVYRWARSLIDQRRLTTVLDVGCGVATKLEEFIVPTGAQVVGLDQIAAVDACRLLGRSGEFHAVDLESPNLVAPGRFGLVICADVLEHLVDPSHTMRVIREATENDGLALLSTPERTRRRGRRCMGSDKPEHVREWARGEFVRFVESCGLRVIRSRLTPQDETPTRSVILGEVAFRLRMTGRSRLACHSVLCAPG